MPQCGRNGSFPFVGHTGLVLTGGGARAAYQVGVLRALSEIAPAGPLPFDVIAGISAGAINSVALATVAESFHDGARRLAATWAALTPDRIFRTGTLRLASIGSRWIRDLSAGGILGKTGINYLLDSSPLRALLSERIPTRVERVQGSTSAAPSKNVTPMPVW